MKYLSNKTFKQFLIETPIDDYKTYGDWSKNQSFKDPKDRLMVTSPKAIEHKKQKFGNSDVTWNLYFINAPGLRKFLETGEVDLNWVKENIKNKDLVNDISKNVGEDCINVIFTNNSGDEKKGMTSWITAHRILHALARKNGSGTRTYYREMANHLISQISEILELYNIKGFPKSYDRLSMRSSFSSAARDLRTDQLLFKNFFQNICTFKSARDKNIRDWFEVMNELGAQYITTGHIKFNKAPTTFSYRSQNGVRHYRTDKTEEVNEHLGMLSRDMEYMFNDLFSSSLGSIFVM